MYKRQRYNCLSDLKWFFILIVWLDKWLYYRDLKSDVHCYYYTISNPTQCSRLTCVFRLCLNVWLYYSTFRRHPENEEFQQSLIIFQSQYYILLDLCVCVCAWSRPCAYVVYNASLFMCSSIEVLTIDCMAFSSETVSYTHLDVYKRQE